MFPSPNGKKILLGVTVRTAAYKACELMRLFKKSGASVKVIMTDTATEFIQPLTFEILSKNRVYNKMFEWRQVGSKHVVKLAMAEC